MQFKTEDLLDLLYGCEVEDMELIEDSIVDTSRWSEIHWIVFKYKDKFYATDYSQGLTECQDESPFEYEGEMVNCHEVYPVEVKVIKYVTSEKRNELLQEVSPTQTKER